MTTLKFIRATKDSDLLLLGIFEEGETARYTVSSETLEAIGSPAVGDLLDQGQTSAIKYADELYRARKKALSLLAFADNNKRTLGMKLSRAGFCRDIVEEVCREMLSLGYINERRQLERLILVEANQKLRGPGRIIPALVAKGFSSSDVSEVMRSLISSGEIDFAENAERLLEKKLPADGEERKKLLYKNGYKI